MDSPHADRPSMPSEYAVPQPAEPSGLLPWSWAVERLSNSRGHWIASTRPDGRPHLMVVWGVWLENRLLFATSERSRKARNLAANPRCVISTERAEEAVIVEGVVEPVADRALARRFLEVYRQKYSDDVDTNVYAVRPLVAFGFISNADQWAGSATRWRFSHAAHE